MVPQFLLKISSTSVTQNWFQKCSSKLVPQVLLKIDPQTLLKIDPQTLLKIVSQTLLKIDPQKLLRIGFTNVNQNWFHKLYSTQKWSASILKISSTSVTQNCFHECYSKLVSQVALILSYLQRLHD